MTNTTLLYERLRQGDAVRIRSVQVTNDSLSQLTLIAPTYLSNTLPHIIAKQIRV
jgi:hypothetical protein